MKKKAMQMARSNCMITCNICGGQFMSKYGIMDGEVYCPKCYNMYLEKQAADIEQIARIRLNRTILRCICFVIALTALILAIVFFDKGDSKLMFSLAIVSCVVIAIFPFYPAILTINLLLKSIKEIYFLQGSVIKKKKKKPSLFPSQS